MLMISTPGNENKEYKHIIAWRVQADCKEGNVILIVPAETKEQAMLFAAGHLKKPVPQDNNKSALDIDTYNAIRASMDNFSAEMDNGTVNEYMSSTENHPYIHAEHVSIYS